MKYLYGDEKSVVFESEEEPVVLGCALANYLEMCKKFGWDKETSEDHKIYLATKKMVESFNNPIFDE